MRFRVILKGVENHLNKRGRHTAEARGAATLLLRGSRRKHFGVMNRGGKNGCCRPSPSRRATTIILEKEERGVTKQLKKAEGEG